MISQGDFALLGLLSTATELGVYYFAFTIAAQSIRLLNSTSTAVIQPFLASRNPDAAANSAITAVRAIGTPILHLCVLQAILLPKVVPIIFGDKWLSAVPTAQLLSIGLGFEALTWPLGAALLSNGQLRIWFTSMIPMSVAFLFLCVLFASGGSLSMAKGAFVYYVAVTPLWSLLVARPLKISIFQIAKCYLEATITVTIAGIITHTTCHNQLNSPPPPNPLWGEPMLNSLFACTLFTTLSLLLLFWTKNPAIRLAGEITSRKYGQSTSVK
jgi:O-antigen/teichoic acid export membrane protein